MIQSDIFDSSKMDIKKLSNKILTFLIKRLIEIFGILVILCGVLMLTALISYSPEDPNFIFPENTEIKNILGYQGSFVSDLIFQSVGLIAYLIPITLIFTGINIFKRKEIFLLVENTFYVVIYSFFVSLFFSLFYLNTFTLYINGNGGFVGNYLSGSFIKSLTNSYNDVSFYLFIIVTLLFFLISINFNLKSFFFNFKKFINFVFKKGSKNYTNQNEVISEFIPQEEIKDLIQEDLPFIKADTNKSLNKNKFILIC